MSWYEDHLQAVRRRWKQKKEESNMSEKEFLIYARKTLLGYGWTEEEVDRILK